MLNIFKNKSSDFIEVNNIEEHTWVKLVAPTTDELNRVSQELEIPIEFLKSALDRDEKSRIENEGNVKLVIVDIPMNDHDMPEYEAFSTIPMAIILTEKCIVTVCLHDTSILKDISDGKIKNIQINYSSRFLYTILLRVASRFLLYLYRIEKTSNKIERQLNVSLRNEQLLQLLALSKSLTYFETSLKASEITIKKIQRGNIVRIFEEDMDLLEDTLIEISQAIEMAGSYSKILKATMETYSSVASNNLNLIMKVLAVITIVMAVPEIIFGFYGMNVSKLPYNHFYWFPILISVVGSALIWIIIKKAKFYR